jgi:hypothetical protein
MVKVKKGDYVIFKKTTNWQEIKEGIIKEVVNGCMAMKIKISSTREQWYDNYEIDICYARRATLYERIRYINWEEILITFFIIFASLLLTIVIVKLFGGGLK